MYVNLKILFIRLICSTRFIIIIRNIPPNIQVTPNLSLMKMLLRPMRHMVQGRSTVPLLTHIFPWNIIVQRLRDAINRPILILAELIPAQWLSH